jgi:hypothetical protein
MTTAAPMQETQYTIQSDPRQVRQIPVALLGIDPNKQREIRNNRKCAERARTWDWNKAEAATVTPSRSEPSHFDVIEGQHRIVSLKMAIDEGLAPRDLTFPCFIVEGLSNAQQSLLGVEIPRSRMTHNAVEKWRQDVRAGRPHQIQVEIVLARHGLGFARKPSSVSLSCVATVEGLVRRYDAHTGAGYLSQTLTILELAYPGSSISAVARWNRHLIQAVFDLVVNNAERLDHVRLAQKLSLMPAESWVELGRGHRGGGVVTIREELTRRYNLNLKTRRI